MDNLTVLRPQYLTRVSEYVPEVIAYIEKNENGFAYEIDGSVYFDTLAFVEAGRNYGKLETWSVGIEALITEREGALTACDDKIKKSKTSAGDFFLWKTCKPE